MFHAAASRIRRLANQTQLKKGRRGQSIVEFALAVPIFLALLLGTIDVGLLFKTQAAYQEAAQQAVRVAASVDGSDQAGLNQLVATLGGENLSNITSVTIYDANLDGSFVNPSDHTTYTTYVYSPGSGFVCQGSPPGSACTSATMWAPSTRHTTVGSLDHMGVQIKYVYHSITGVLGPFQLTQTAVAELEPTSY